MEFCCDHHIEEKNAGQHIVEVNGEQVYTTTVKLRQDDHCMKLKWSQN